MVAELVFAAWLCHWVGVVCASLACVVVAACALGTRLGVVFLYFIGSFSWSGSLAPVSRCGVFSCGKWFGLVSSLVVQFSGGDHMGARFFNQLCVVGDVELS